MSRKKNSKETRKRAMFRNQVDGILKLKLLVIGSIIGLSVAGLATMVVTKLDNSRVVHDEVNYHPATYKVAEKFLCGCDQCNMELTACNCNQSTGGTYELYFISEQLKAGLSETQAIQAVNNKFGKLRQPPQNRR